MKKTMGLAICLLMVIGLLLSGCQGSGGSKNATADKGGGSNGNGSSGGKVTITLWDRISPHLFDDATKGFEKAHPNIKVNIVHVPESNKAKAQYQAAVSQNSLPDVFSGEKYTTSQFVALNQVHPLDEVFTPEVKKEFPSSTWYAGKTTLNGHVYMMPIYSATGGVMMMFYNKKILQKYGITNIPKTWDELIAASQKIYQKSNGQVYGVLMGAQSNYIGGGSAKRIAHTISPETGMDYRTGQYNYATKGMLQTFEFFKELKDKNGLDPQSLTLSDIKAIPIFTAGRDAFLISGNYAAGIMRDQDPNFKDFDFGVTALPRKSASDRIPYQNLSGGAKGIYASKYTKHWPQVKFYLQYLEKHLYASVVKDGRQPPAKKLSIIGDVKSDTPHYQDIMKLVEKSNVEVPNPIEHKTETWKVSSKYSSLKPQNSVGDILNGYLSGKVKDPKAALQQLSEGSNQALEKALKSDDKVSIKDYQFPDWVPGKPYTK